MEESDNLLITTLREFIKVSPNINNLKDIRTQQIFAISINVLEQLNFDAVEVKSLSAKQQKFRAMAKLNQSLQAALQTQFQLNDLMNPSVTFLRKFMLTLINKLGSGQGNQKSKMKKQGIENKKQGVKQLKKWLSEEWIHPSLCIKKQKYRGYLLPLTINKNMLKNNINLTAELNNPLLSCNNQAILNATSDKLNQRVKQFEANQGFSRKQNQEAQIRLQNIIKFSKDDWNITGIKLQKLKKKVIEAQNQNQSEIEVPMVGSVFKLELEQAENQEKKKKEQVKPKFQRNLVQQTVASMNPLQLLKRQGQNRKRQYQNEIQDILNQLNQRKQAIQQWERRKQQIETQNIADDQRIAKLKQQTIDLKKQVEKRQTILATLEGEKDIEEETNKLQGEIDMIENQVKEEVNRIQNQIKEMETQSKEKMEALGDLKAKLARVQEQYEKICEEITEKQELKGNVKIQTSTISRLYYHKKISEMEARWRQTDKETKKLKTTLKELRQKTRVASTLSARVQTQIQNILNVQKTRNQPQTKLLRQLMLKCKQAYQRTMNILQQASIVKMQTQDYEVKVHTLSGKNYKHNIQKINHAMEDLRKETAEFLKSKPK